MRDQINAPVFTLVGEEGLEREAARDSDGDLFEQEGNNFRREEKRELG